MYSAAAANENYLRGVHETDDNGAVTFTTIFPECYGGRWPHIHFEVCSEPERAGYEASVSNLSRNSLDSDDVLSDGVDL